MKSLFVVKFPPDANLPPADAETGVQLHYMDAEGKTCGGWSCIGLVPQAPTCVVLVDSSAATTTAMKADSAYLWLEEVPDV